MESIKILNTLRIPCFFVLLNNISRFLVIIKFFFDYYQKSYEYYYVEQKIEQTRFLNYEKRFKNNDFRRFFVKSGKFDDQTKPS